MLCQGQTMENLNGAMDTKGKYGKKQLAFFGETGANM
jgi:hypothetical protein